MPSRMILALLLLNAFTMAGVLMGDRLPPECVDSKNLLCGTPLSSMYESVQRLSISLNPLTIAAAFNSLVLLLAGLLWYNYAILNQSDNILVIIYVWSIRAVITSIGAKLFWDAFPQVGNVLARFVGR